MAKIRNKSGDDRTVTGLGGRLVLAGQKVDVPVEDVHSYTCQVTIWEPADDEAQAAHDAAETPTGDAESGTDENDEAAG